MTIPTHATADERRTLRQLQFRRHRIRIAIKLLEEIQIMRRKRPVPMAQMCREFAAVRDAEWSRLA